MTAIFRLRSVAVMLAASDSTPNPSPQVSPQQTGPQQTAPNIAVVKPDGWCGVDQGLKDARSLMHEKYLVHAEDVLLQLLEFAPMEGKAWHMLGRCHQTQQRHSKALECFERAACCYRNQNMADQPPASAAIAQLLWNQGEKTQAEAMLDALLATRPDDAKLQAMRATWHEQHDDTASGTDSVTFNQTDSRQGKAQ